MALDYIDEELNELYKNLSKTNGNLDDLYKLLLDKELDKKNSEFEINKNNEGLLYSDPNYIDVDNNDSIYSLLKRMIDMGSFSNIDEFNNYIDYIVNHKCFSMLVNLNELTNLCYSILSIEGVKFNEFSEYSLPYVNKLKELIPEYLDVENYNRYKEVFKIDLVKVDGLTINDLFLFLWGIEKNNIDMLKEDILNNYRIVFDLFDDSLRREDLDLFINTLLKYSNIYNKKVKM